MGSSERAENGSLLLGRYSALQFAELTRWVVASNDDHSLIYECRLTECDLTGLLPGTKVMGCYIERCLLPADRSGFDNCIFVGHSNEIDAREEGLIHG